MNSFPKPIMVITAALIFLISCSETQIKSPNLTLVPSPAGTEEPISNPTPIPVEQLATNEDDQLRLKFFRGGHVWSFRIVSSDTSQTESQWTLLILAGKSALEDVPEIQVGSTIFTGEKLEIEAAKRVLSLLHADYNTNRDFFHLFADGIERGEFEARLLETAPPQEGSTVDIATAAPLTKQELLELIDAMKQ